MKWCINTTYLNEITVHPLFFLIDIIISKFMKTQHFQSFLTIFPRPGNTILEDFWKSGDKLEKSQWRRTVDIGVTTVLIKEGLFCVHMTAHITPMDTQFVNKTNKALSTRTVITASTHWFITVNWLVSNKRKSFSPETYQEHETNVGFLCNLVFRGNWYGPFTTDLLLWTSFHVF